VNWKIKYAYLYVYLHVLGALLSANVLLAQAPQPVLHHYTVDEGLPSSEVYYALQDSRGYMWFATDRGVSRFNGYEFENFSTKDGLSDNTVFLIFEDFKTRIWYCTYSGRLSYFENDSIHTYKYNDKIAASIQKNQIILSFHVDKLETVHLGLQANGWLQVDSAGVVSSVLPRSKGKTKCGNVVTMIEDAPFCFSYTRTMEMESPNYLFEIWEDDIDEVYSSLRVDYRSHNHLSAIKRNNEDYVMALGNLIATRSKTSIFSISSIDKGVISLFEDSKESLYMGYDKGGVSCKQQNGRTYTLLGDKSVSAMCEDTEGGLWFTTLDNGVYYMASRAFSSLASRLEVRGVRATKITGNGRDEVYVGYDHGLIAVIDTLFHVELYSSNAVNPDTASSITSLFFDEQDNRLWVGCGPGSFVLQEGEIPFSISKFSGYAFSRKLDENLVGGGYSGLFEISKGKVIRGKYDATIGYRVYCLLNLPTGELLLGADDGVWKWTNNKREPYGSHIPELKSRIADMALAANNTLWIATRGEGLIMYNTANDSATVINTENGLNSDLLNAVYLEDEVLWVVSSHGLNRIVLSDDNEPKVQGYSVIDGLPSNELYDVHVQNNAVWLATNKGVARFIPEQMDTIQPSLPLGIVKFEANNKAMAHTSYVELPYDVRNLKIEFQGLGYKEAGNLKYRYKVHGNDTAWNYTGNRSVEFPSLTVGDYEFVVQVQNSRGAWSKSTAYLRFSVLPPFWKTWWFIILSIFGSCGVIYSFFKVRVLTYNRDVVREILLAIYNRFDTRRFLVVHVDYKMYKIDVNHILWIKAERNYVEIVTTKRNYVVRSTLTDFQEQIPDKFNFVKVHRSYIVHRKKIEGIDGTDLIVNLIRIPVGKSFSHLLPVLAAELKLAI